ncbi:MarR family winged helix-turn-helix transcriptional regulator [Modestobacter roseus]|uniref:DNA-binding MarR family transcriptional regulator n=1 Tax=Modestobacter roseus TaxID=1181884 RepID=A0A562IWX5_9ACTN|nr:MarR family transcriptional regulator [Modestobacter roseus]MQA34807.1 MarR family transcriptional regulator [Modestobacter roseus]TWH75561.1 DNA-binding MarR family transcriptional regulator [Modestobacter roseus]
MTQPAVHLETSVGLALKQAAAALRTAMDAALRPLDLGVSQYACLEQLRHRPGLSAAELARATFVTRQSMHAVLQGLQERGLLTRPATAPAGRALPTELTTAGASLLDRASRAVAEVEQRMLTALSAPAAARLQQDLLACVAALEAQAR